MPSTGSLLINILESRSIKGSIHWGRDLHHPPSNASHWGSSGQFSTPRLSHSVDLYTPPTRYRISGSSELNILLEQSTFLSLPSALKQSICCPNNLNSRTSSIEVPIISAEPQHESHIMCHYEKKNIVSVLNGLRPTDRLQRRKAHKHYGPLVKKKKKKSLQPQDS